TPAGSRGPFPAPPWSRRSSKAAKADHLAHSLRSFSSGGLRPARLRQGSSEARRHPRMRAPPWRAVAAFAAKSNHMAGPSPPPQSPRLALGAYTPNQYLSRARGWRVTGARRRRSARTGEPVEAREHRWAVTRRGPRGCPLGTDSQHAPLVWLAR